MSCCTNSKESVNRSADTDGEHASITAACRTAEVSDRCLSLERGVFPMSCIYLFIYFCSFILIKASFLLLLCTCRLSSCMTQLLFATWPFDVIFTTNKVILTFLRSSRELPVCVWGGVHVCVCVCMCVRAAFIFTSASHSFMMESSSSSWLERKNLLSNTSAQFGAAGGQRLPHFHIHFTRLLFIYFPDLRVKVYFYV